mmetsp:Transcript_118425/g.342416  ORF Transcript_118425/g.342416 Transcript_118425/m.342416 type:complete len:234 (+) Transcript_118425:261-962(+)
MPLGVRCAEQDGRRRSTPRGGSNDLCACDEKTGREPRASPTPAPFYDNSASASRRLSSSFNCLKRSSSASFSSVACSSSKISAQVRPSPLRASNCKPILMVSKAPGVIKGEGGWCSRVFADLGGKLVARWALGAVVVALTCSVPLTWFRAAIQPSKLGDSERCLPGEKPRDFDRCPPGCICATVARHEAVRGESPARTTPSGSTGASSVLALKRLASQLSSSGSYRWSVAWMP